MRSQWIEHNGKKIFLQDFSKLFYNSAAVKAELAEVAKIAEDMGYDEININLGCPSKKVQTNNVWKIGK